MKKLLRWFCLRFHPSHIVISLSAESGRTLYCRKCERYL
jgi:hypothetical protein